MIAGLEKQLAQAKARLEDPEAGHKRYAETQARLKEAEGKAAELSKQLRHMERI
jgi:hypothetical protein